MEVVFFPFHDWNKCVAEGFRTRDGHVLEGLLAHPDVSRVICVNRPIPLPLWRSWGHPLDTLRRGFRVTHPTAGLAVVDTIDHTWSNLLPRPAVHNWWPRAVAAERRVDAVRTALDSLVSDRAVAFVCTPYEAAVSERFGFRARVFDAIDDWEIHPLMQAGRASSRAGYDAVRGSFDLAFAVSSPLAERLRGGRPRVIELRNGVGSRFLEPALVPPGTRIGYAGKIASRIDVDLVAAVAAKSPVPVEMAGPVLDRDVGARLRSLPNVRLLGDLQYADLPAFVDSLRVALIPHSVGGQENGGDPIKIYEYLARGRTVVTTPILGMERFDQISPVTVALGEDFVDAVLHGYQSPIEPAVARGALSEDDTWDHKVARMVAEMRHL